jgi:hypothetical protein
MDFCLFAPSQASYQYIFTRGSYHRPDLGAPSTTNCYIADAVVPAKAAVILFFVAKTVLKVENLIVASFNSTTWRHCSSPNRKVAAEGCRHFCLCQGCQVSAIINSNYWLSSFPCSFFTCSFRKAANMSHVAD